MSFVGSGRARRPRRRPFAYQLLRHGPAQRQTAAVVRHQNRLGRTGRCRPFGHRVDDGRLALPRRHRRLRAFRHRRPFDGHGPSVLWRRRRRFDDGGRVATIGGRGAPSPSASRRRRQQTDLFVQPGLPLVFGFEKRADDFRAAVRGRDRFDPVPAQFVLVEAPYSRRTARPVVAHRRRRLPSVVVLIVVVVAVEPAAHRLVQRARPPSPAPSPLPFGPPTPRRPRRRLFRAQRIATAVVQSVFVVLFVVVVVVVVHLTLVTVVG